MACSISATEYAALQSFFVNLNGNGWVAPPPGEVSWSFPSLLSAPCSLTNPWQGVTCSQSSLDPRNCSVYSITLESSSLKGSLPNDLSNLHALNSIDLTANSVTGVLPSEWQYFTGISSITLYMNSISGTVPLSWTSLLSLTFLDLGQNYLEGTLIESFTSLQSMTALFININYITGTIPLSWSRFTNMEIIFLDTNYLYGTMPQEWTSMKSMGYVSLSYNYFHGTLPAIWSQWSAMTYAYLDTNPLSGSIPSEWSVWSRMFIFSIENANMHQNLPLYLTAWSNVTILSLNGNSFTGTLPSEWGVFKYLQSLDLDQNELVGTLPWQWSSMTSMIVLSLESNQFEGTLPAEWSSMRQIEYILLYLNALSGTLPMSWSAMTAITFLDIGVSQLTGTLPPSWSTMKGMEYFFVNKNELSGTFPSEWSVFSDMSQIFLAANRFHGEPLFYPLIEELRYDTNFFSGKIEPSDFYLLQYFNISDNFFDGGIDFLATATKPSMYFLDLSLNQFSGTIPLNKLQQATPSMQAIIMSDNCFHGSIEAGICNWHHLQIVAMDKLSAGKKCAAMTLSQAVGILMEGSVPTCVFSMRKLNTLHLIGNGLSGSLGDLHRNSSLEVVAMMSNYITGSIPSNWQYHNKWSQLLLSYNKISGDLQNDFIVQDHLQFVNLSSNRLSGYIPSTFRQLSTMDVVEGNVFSCSSHYSNDVNRGTYSCGSQELTYVFYCYVVVFVVVILCCFQFSSESLAIFVSELHCSPMITSLSFYCGILLALAIILRVILSLCYKASNQYKYIYAWVLTTVYVREAAPIVLLLIFSIMLAYVLNTVTIGKHSDQSVITLDIKFDKEKIHWRSVFLQLVNILVISTLTVIYIVVVLEKASSIVQLIYAICLAIFKVTWNSLYVKWMVQNISRTSFPKTFRNEVIADMFSFVICPVAVIFTTDVKCFKYAISKISSVATTYNIPVQNCLPYVDENFDGTYSSYIVCDSYVYKSTSNIQPPWLYSYQCSSNIITSYVSVVFYSYLLYLVFLSGSKLWLIVQPREFRVGLIEKHRFLKNFIFFTMSHLRDLTSYSEVESSIRNNSIRQTSFIHSRIIRHLVMLLFYGLASPVLGFMILGALMLDDIVMKMQIRVLERDLNNTGAFNSQQISHLLNSFFLRNTWYVYRFSFPICLVIVIFYWSYAAYDMIADAYGSVTGIVIFFVYGFFNVMIMITIVRMKRKDAESHIDMDPRHSEVELLAMEFHPTNFRPSETNMMMIELTAKENQTK